MKAWMDVWIIMGGWMDHIMNGWIINDGWMDHHHIIFILYFSMLQNPVTGALNVFTVLQRNSGVI